MQLFLEKYFSPLMLNRSFVVLLAQCFGDRRIYIFIQMKANPLTHPAIPLISLALEKDSFA
jgi:hypothetical protein